MELIRHSYATSHGVYGSPRLFLALQEMGATCSEDRVAKIMRQNNIKALHGYTAPKIIHGRPFIIATKTLQRNFKADRPNISWVTDMTYIRTWQGL